MANICFYFEIHQPWRLNNLSVFDIGNDKDGFDIDEKFDYSNKRVMKKVADKSYRPMLSLLLQLLKDNSEFRFSLSVTGVALEQMIDFAPDLIDLLKEAVETGRVELLAETYYHSLAGLYSEGEFVDQIKMHKKILGELFGVSPKIFRNTELIYTNRIAEVVKEMGFDGMLAEGVDRILGWRRPTSVYQSPGGLSLLLKHYQLSDDIAFRFSAASRSDKPLTAETFCHWVNSSYSDQETVNLFMDFETFGEHQWSDTGIFDFFRKMVHEFTEKGGKFVLPSEVVDKFPAVGVFDSKSPVSWADVDRDVTAWIGNEMQVGALNTIYELEEPVKKSGSDKLLKIWRKLQTSDHFYYMCTKWSADGDVHAYFSPYGSPYNAYSNFSNAVSDLKIKLFN